MKDKTPVQLQTLVRDTREKLRAMRFAGAGAATRNVKETKNMRKEIARAMTELSAQNK